MTAAPTAARPGPRPGRILVWGCWLLLILTAGVLAHGIFRASSNAVFDAYQRLSPGRPAGADLVVIEIDDDSLHRVGQWPWRRDQLARLVDAAAGARVVGLDILLSEPDRFSSAAVLAAWPGLDPAAAAAVAAMPQPDSVLARSLASVPVVLAAAARATPEEGPGTPIAYTPIFESGSGRWRSLPAYPAVAWPLPPFAAAARGLGLVSALPEADGVMRRIPVVQAVGPALVPSFAAEVTRVATGAERIELRTGPLAGPALLIGRLRLPIDRAGRAWPDFAPYGIERVSAWRVLEGLVPPAQFRDRIVLIGAGAVGLGDVITTPLARDEPSVLAQAQLIASILGGSLLRRPLAAEGGEVLFALALSAAALLLLGRVPDRAYGVLFVGVAVLMVGASWASYRGAGLLLDWTYPMAALIGAMLVALVLRIGDEVEARRRNERQLAAALMRAEAADRAKTEFLANASHELRTPLTAIIGLSDLMASEMLGELPPPYAGYARNIHAAASHLHGIISDILDLAVIDLGGRKPADDTVEVSALVANAAQLIRLSLGTERKVRIRTAMPSGLPRLRADSRMVKQMLINLLSNAAKYSPDGGEVVVGAARSSDGGLEVTVRDSGPGIAAADIAYAMQPFGRLRSAKLSQAPGIGIGLPLTKSMVELHGGTLSLRSQVGAGTEACLWFPPARLLAERETT